MFSKLAGNRRVKETLGRLLAVRRVPNALLFAGADGIGKKLFALEIAKAFVCNSPDGLEGCDECPACRRVSVFNIPKPEKKDDFKQVFFSEHADVGMVVPFNKNILVDAIRELEREAYFRPFEAKARFFIIDDADKMNDAASNALLKTLEEPASTSHIILISSRPDSLLQTIRSRCQTIRFAPVETEKIEEVLLNTNKFSIDDAKLAARLSDGSVRRALSMDVAKFREQRELMLDVLQCLLIRRNRASLLQTAELMNDAKNKDSYEDNLSILLSLIRDIWILSLTGGEENIVNTDIVPPLKQLAENAESHRLSSWMAEIELLRENFIVNINRKVATDALFMQMAV
ncbi:MAG: DNA polymerase III subunit delta' [Saprospiraceae bacterium]|nr:DNA polymerase III subunit delta' [Pyrinomonadaceae bacterium]